MCLESKMQSEFPQTLETLEKMLSEMRVRNHIYDIIVQKHQKKLASWLIHYGLGSKDVEEVHHALSWDSDDLPNEEVSDVDNRSSLPLQALQLK